MCGMRVGGESMAKMYRDCIWISLNESRAPAHYQISLSEKKKQNSLCLQFGYHGKPKKFPFAQSGKSIYKEQNKMKMSTPSFIENLAQNKTCAQLNILHIIHLIFSQKSQMIGIIFTSFIQMSKPRLIQSFTIIKQQL